MKIAYRFGWKLEKQPVQNVERKFQKRNSFDFFCLQVMKSLKFKNQQRKKLKRGKENVCQKIQDFIQGMTLKEIIKLDTFKPKPVLHLKIEGMDIDGMRVQGMYELKKDLQ